MKPLEPGRGANPVRVATPGRRSAPPPRLRSGGGWQGSRAAYAEMGVAGRVAAGLGRVGAKVGRYVGDRIFDGLDDALADVAAGPGRAAGSVLSGEAFRHNWGRFARWRLPIEDWDRQRRRRALMEFMGDTAGGVWSSVWRRGA